MCDAITDKKKEMYENARLDAMENCIMLYGGGGRITRRQPADFPWECPDTWNDVLRDLSYSLEALNVMYYSRYGIRIAATQVKEKFGRLCFYYDVRKFAPHVLSYVSDFFKFLHDKMNRIDYRYERLADSPMYVSHEVEEITESAYEKFVNLGYCASNVAYEKTDGKCYKVAHIYHYRRSHYEPTRHKVLYGVMKFFLKLSAILDFSQYWTASKSQLVMAEYASLKANECIGNANRRLEKICSKCGTDIRNDEYPPCVTTDWVAVMCKQCADESGENYSMDGKVYNRGKLVETGKPSC